MRKVYVQLKEAGFSFAKVCFLVTDEFLVRCNRQVFCVLYNLRSFLLGWDARFFYERDRKLFYAFTGERKHFFLNRRQALNAYRWSLPRRAKDLARVYHLDAVGLQDGDTVVDCGANVGDLLLSLESYGKNIRYYGFEPSPSEFSCLRLNAKDYKACNMGLWNQSGQLNFYLSSDGADSSFIEPRVFDEIRRVDTKRLDEILPGDIEIKLLKLEAEGAEPEVIEGLGSLLHNISYISADLGFERGIDEESTLCPVVNHLLANGFELVALTGGRMVALFKNKLICG